MMNENLPVSYMEQHRAAQLRLSLAKEQQQRETAAGHRLSAGQVRPAPQYRQFDKRKLISQ
jgi:hypothetical protein